MNDSTTVPASTPTRCNEDGTAFLDLYPYQETGVERLLNQKRAGLWFECGLGKTPTALVAADVVGRPTLVVCPASVVDNWRQHIDEWTNNPNMFDVISDASLHKLAGMKKWDVIIVDESHRFKNHKAKRTKNLYSLTAHCEYLWMLTATPMPNHPGELFTHFDLLRPDLIKDTPGWWRFTRKYCNINVTPWGEKITGHNKRHAATLAHKLQELALRYRIEDVALELPPLRVALEYLPDRLDLLRGLTPEDREAVRRVAEEDDNPNNPHVMRARRMIGMAKAPATAQRISEELLDGAYQKVVVMYHHKDVEGRLFDQFTANGLLPLVLNGDTPQHKRQGIVDDFSNDPGQRVILVQQGVGGTGLNLQAAHEIVLAEPDWVPDQNHQAIKRIHRIGQENPCRARIFTSRKSLDEKIMKALVHKTATQKAIGL